MKAYGSVTGPVLPYASRRFNIKDLQRRQKICYIEKPRQSFKVPLQCCGNLLQPTGLDYQVDFSAEQEI